MTRALLLVLALAATARADVWTDAIERGSADSSRDRYEAALQEGDGLAQKANARGNSIRVATALVDEAVRAYKVAAAARPKEGEPWFRIASVIESYFTDCGPLMLQRPVTCPASQAYRVDPVRAKEAVEAWDEFEARAPLDPRISESLFARAILRTKLVTTTKDAKGHLEGALRDYTALLDRADGLTLLRLDQVWGNLAETYMMLGKLDEAIDAYQVALDKGAGSSTAYGKAVAMDRDERTTEALDLIRRQGVRSFEEYREDLTLGAVFYVPQGEEQYYFGMIYEALGYNTEAIAAWNAFIKSGAHPQYQARAKWHLEQLAKKPVSRPRTLDPFDAYP